MEVSFCGMRLFSCSLRRHVRMCVLRGGSASDESLVSFAVCRNSASPPLYIPRHAKVRLLLTGGIVFCTPRDTHARARNPSLDSTRPHEKRQSRTDGESTALELQQVRSRLTKAKKEAHRLEKILAQSTAHNKAEAPAGGRRSAPRSPSPGAILGDWVAEERPRTDGGERTWALSRKSSNGSSAVSKEASPLARSASAPAAAAPAPAATSKGPSARRGEHAEFGSLLHRRLATQSCFSRWKGGHGGGFAGCHVTIASLAHLRPAVFVGALQKRCSQACEGGARGGARVARLR